MIPAQAAIDALEPDFLAGGYRFGVS